MRSEIKDGREIRYCSVAEVESYRDSWEIVDYDDEFDSCSNHWITYYCKEPVSGKIFSLNYLGNEVGRTQTQEKENSIEVIQVFAKTRTITVYE